MAVSRGELTDETVDTTIDDLSRVYHTHEDAIFLNYWYHMEDDPEGAARIFDELADKLEKSE